MWYQEQFLAPDPWFESPCGWLRKPDFKRTEQKAFTTQAHFTPKRSSMLTIKALFQSAFKKRWFELNIHSNQLGYFDSANKFEQSHLGSIDLNRVRCLRPSVVFDAPPNSIDLVCSDHVYTLVADSYELMCKWAYVIERILVKLRDAVEIKSIVETAFLDRQSSLLSPQKTVSSAATVSKLIRRLDFSPHELVTNIMAYADPERSATELNPQLRAFFAKVVFSLQHTLDIAPQIFCAIRAIGAGHSREDLVRGLKIVTFV
jgi:hypothetical protein